MKVILYMATSINGYITRGEDDSNWVSGVDWQEFDKLKRECGIIVMGSKTYEQFGDEFPQEGALNIVMTHKPNLLAKVVDGAIFTDKTPFEAVELAKQKGHDKLMLIGGMTLNTSFLKANLINEIWLDVHPLMIGEGKTMFEKNDIFKKIELLEAKDLEEGQVLLKYKVKP